MAEAERRAATAGEAAAGGTGSAPHGFDRDLDLRAILAFGASLTLVAMALLHASANQ